MIRKVFLFIILLSNFIATKASAALYTEWNPYKLICLPVAIGDMGIPLIPLIHAYNTVDSHASRFHKIIPLPENNCTIFSIQSLSSASSKQCGGGLVQFKPQWSIALGLPSGFFSATASPFDIGIRVNCRVDVICSDGKINNFSFNDKYVNFHAPGHVSPDIMSLEFDGKDDFSRAIEYDVEYFGGNGSKFAELKNGTRQKGIILLLNDEDLRELETALTSPTIYSTFVPLYRLHESLLKTSLIKTNEYLRQKLGIEKIDLTKKREKAMNDLLESLSLQSAPIEYQITRIEDSLSLFQDEILPDGDSIETRIQRIKAEFSASRNDYLEQLKALANLILTSE